MDMKIREVNENKK
jgi:hypothetical protein